MKKRVLALFMCTAMAVSLFAGCSKPAAESKAETDASVESAAAETAGEEAVGGDLSGQSIEVATYLSGDTLEAYKTIIKGFEEETGVTVVLNEYGNDYESTMKTRMAARSLPDVFETHGWSLIRYKEYLMDLSTQPWADQLSEAAMGVIRDDDGSFYTLMTTGSCLGVAVNMDVCEAAGVDPWSIVTWDDFNAACETIKNAGYVPIANYFSSAGALANHVGTFLNYENEMYDCSEEMLNGTWDWEEYGVVLDEIKYWFDNGFLYEDCATFAQSDAIERTARGECAFVVGIGTSFQTAVVALNPDVNMGMLPVFASTENGARFCGIGEGASFGIWKDTEKLEACEAFLAYIVENADLLNAAAGEISTLPNELTKSYGMQMMETMEEHVPDVYYDNLWDRKYMPSGMWSIFGTAAGMFCEDQSDASKAEVIEYLRENYVELYETAQEE